MQIDDIEFKQLEFKWQKQKFLIIILTVLVSLFAVSVSLSSLLRVSSYEEYSAARLVDETRSVIADTRVTQRELLDRIKNLEGRQVKLDNDLRLLGGSVAETQKLLLAVKADLDELRKEK